MSLKLRIADVLSPDLLAVHHDHIRDFLWQEGITPDASEIGATQLNERQLKELLAELADDAEEDVT